jgi:pimeloyl-ACP methyl ester carboxylesterase
MSCHCLVQTATSSCPICAALDTPTSIVSIHPRDTALRPRLAASWPSSTNSVWVGRVIGGYDIGSRIAQTVAKDNPGLVKHLVLSPPLPGVGSRVLDHNAQKQFWYQAFHQLSLPDELIDGKPDAVRSYLRHFWAHWSGPTFSIADTDLDHLTAVYSPPGAFTASIDWYRAGAGTVAISLAEQAPRPDHRISTPTSVLWPAHDPLFPREWSDRLDEFFTNAQLNAVDGGGHFTPVECPAEFAELISRAVTSA